MRDISCHKCGRQALSANQRAVGCGYSWCPWDIAVPKVVPEKTADAVPVPEKDPVPLKWEHILYRVEWCTEVIEIDQYGNQTGVLYLKPFPWKDEAVAHLEEISKPDAYVNGRRVWNDAPHGYTVTHVRRREVKVQED